MLQHVPMSDISAFLLSRIAEDEAIAKAAEGCLMPALSPTRILAECEAKRRIIERARTVLYVQWHDEQRYGAEHAARAQELQQVLLALALPYADHPDYNANWRR